MSRQRLNESVELNVTAMLDMAFQLLAFFVLTFRSSPDELGFNMHLPPAHPVVCQTHPNDLEAGLQLTPFIPAGQKTVEVDLFSESGGLDGIALDGAAVATLDDLREQLSARIHMPGSPVEQVVVQAADRLQYAEIMQVVGICAEQEPVDAKQLVKLRLVAMGDKSNF